MRLIFTLLFFIVSTAGFSQKITGIWRGTFVQRQANPFTGEWENFVYKYEVQINQVDAKTIEGVTYSYKQKEFYGKASFRGMFTQTTQNVILKETKMIELKASENSVPCLMTCYLDYSKIGDVEKLKGTFSSVESPGFKNCGGGTVSLQRVLNSDFKKEDFLLKKDVPNKSINTSNSTKINSAKKYIQALQTALGLTADGVAGPKTLQAIKQKIPTFNNKLNVNDSAEIKNLIAQLKTKTSTNKPVVKNITPDKIPQKNIPAEKSLPKKSYETLSAIALSDSPKKIIADTAVKQINVIKIFSTPEILKSRVNKLVNTVTVNEKDIIVDYYDNGEIDGDVISVYDNNKMVLDHDTLSTKPLRLYLHLDENNAYHELITVAENLGTIPPNTCLMVITAGRKRFEIPMASDEQTNAKVILEYHSAEGTKITTPQR